MDVLIQGTATVTESSQSQSKASETKRIGCTPSQAAVGLICWERGPDSPPEKGGAQPERPAKPQKKFWYKDKRNDDLFPYKEEHSIALKPASGPFSCLPFPSLIVHLTITALAVAATMGISPQM